MDVPSPASARLTAIYWTNDETGNIGWANIDGTGVNQSFITGAPNLLDLTIYGDHIYWTNVGAGGLGNAWIGRARLDGSHVNQNFILAGGPAGIAVDGEHIYWSNDGESGALGGGNSIGRSRLDGTHIDQTFITGTNLPNGVAVDSKHVFGRIRVIRRSGERISTARASTKASLPPGLAAPAGLPFTASTSTGPTGTWARSGGRTSMVQA